METATSPVEKKSTNVRPLAVRILRPPLRALSALAPDLATRVGMDLFTRPHGHRAPGPRHPLPAGGHRFTLAAGGFELAAWSWGDGPTVLLQHGWDGRGEQLRAFVEPLVAAGYSVVAHDAPAHGRSPGSHTNMAEWSAAIAGIASRMLGLHAVIAHSIGCVAAAHAMGRGARIDRLVFLSPPADVITFSLQFAELLGFSEEVHERMWRRWEARLGIDRREFAIEATAAGRRTPLLLVHDCDDLDIPREHVERILAAWPEAESLFTEGLGHHRIRSAPEVIERALAFLGPAFAAARPVLEADGPGKADAARLLPAGA